MMCYIISTPPITNYHSMVPPTEVEELNRDPLWIMFFTGIAVHGAEIH